MNKYGLVMFGLVQSIFFSSEPKSAFPDIEQFLMELPAEVECNWSYDGSTFSPPEVL